MSGYAEFGFETQEEADHFEETYDQLCTAVLNYRKIENENVDHSILFYAVMREEVTRLAFELVEGKK